jgi:hypothetical protein
VARGDGAAKIWLRPVRVEYASGLNPAEMQRLREIRIEHEADFLERWNEYFAR